MTTLAYTDCHFSTGSSSENCVDGSGSAAVLTPDRESTTIEPWSVYPQETQSWGVVCGPGDDLDDDEAYFLEDEDDDDLDDDDLDEDYDDDDFDDDEIEADEDIDSDDEDL